MTITAAHDEKFARIPHNVIIRGLTPQAFTLYAALVMRADYETGETYVSRHTLAGHIGATQARSVDRYIRELADAGLILRVQHRWTTQRRDRDDVVFEKDAAHPVQTSSLYTVNLHPKALPQVGPQCARTHGGGAPERTGVVRQNAQEQEPLNENPLNETPKCSPAASPRTSSKSVDKSKRQTPRALPAAWAPNETHYRIGAGRGVDVDVAAAAMRAGGTENGKRLADWDRAFGALLNAIADDTWFSEFPWVADYSEMLTSQAVDQAVDQAVAQVAATSVLFDRADVAEERLEAKIEAAAAQAPTPIPVQVLQPAGFSRTVVDSIEWVAGRLGGLTDTERVDAGRMLNDGRPRSEVWTTIERTREYAAA